MEPVGRSDEDPGRAGGTREPGGAHGSMGDSGGEGVEMEPLGLRAEAGGRCEGFSSHGDDGGWQTRGTRTVLMVG